MADLPTHVRTVHLTLILVCVVTMVSLGGVSPTELDRAQKQMRHITQIKAEWSQWLNRWGLEQVQSLERKGIRQGSGAPTGIHVCDPGIGNWSFQLKGSPMQFLLSVRGTGELVFANAVKKVTGDLQFYSPTQSWPATLEDFKTFWDSAIAIRVRTIENVSPTVHFISADGVDSTYAWAPPCASSSRGLDLQFQGDRIYSKRVLQQFTEHLFCGDIPNEPATVAVPVAIREDRASGSLRSWLVQEYHLQAAAVGFDKDFAELNKVTAPYMLLPLDRAALVLDAEVQRSGERVQLIGLTLPLRTLSLTAAGIIMLVQLYLFLHLQQFQSPASDTERIAWVALYDNVFARLVTLATGVLLPITTCIYVTTAHFSYWNLAFLLVSFMMAVCSVPLFWQLPHVYGQVTTGRENRTGEI